MLGKTYSAIIAISFLFAVTTGHVEEVGKGCISGAVNAVKFMLELGGMMAFWCGIMAVFEKCGLLKLFSRLIKPLLKIIFPDAVKQNVAVEEISMNIGANFLGLGNAATPMGIRAAEKMKSSLAHSDDVVMLTVLNTASVQLIPTTILSLRMISGSDKPYEIIVPIWICSLLTASFAVMITKTLALLRKKRSKTWKS